MVDERTRLRDQQRAPTAAHLVRSVREKARGGLQTFALTADVAEAHQQILVAECDWHLVGQVNPGEEVYISTVGTFGVASASYSWSMVMSALEPLSQCVVGDRAQTWHMPVASMWWCLPCSHRWSSHGTRPREGTSYPGLASSASFIPARHLATERIPEGGRHMNLYRRARKGRSYSKAPTTYT